MDQHIAVSTVICRNGSGYAEDVVGKCPIEVSQAVIAVSDGCRVKIHGKSLSCTAAAVGCNGSVAVDYPDLRLKRRRKGGKLRSHLGEGNIPAAVDRAVFGRKLVGFIIEKIGTFFQEMLVGHLG